MNKMLVINELRFLLKLSICLFFGGIVGESRKDLYSIFISPPKGGYKILVGFQGALTPQ